MRRNVNVGVVPILFFALSAVTFAQRGSIMGIVTDAQNNEPVPYANVILVEPENGGEQKGTVSGADGEFKLAGIQPGNYQLIVSFLGYMGDTIADIRISKEQQLTDLGLLKIHPANVAIDQVEVKANARTVTSKIDRKVYRADEFETAKGASAVEVLNKIPSVSVSPDGEVAVRGTTDFMVYLNGKPTQMEPSVVLAQISSDNIESIEVISVPSARFDAQGKGGIININTKTSGVKGLTVNAAGTLGGAPWGHLTDKYSNYALTDNRYSAVANILYSTGNFSAYGGFTYSMKNVNGSRTGDARILDTTQNAYKHMVASGERPEWYENFTATAGFDYSFSQQTKLSAGYFYGNRTEGRSAFYIYHNFFGDKDKQPIAGVPVDEEWIYNPNTDNRYGIFHTANIDLTHTFTEDSKLSISGLFEHSDLSRNLDNYNYQYDPVNDISGAMELHFQQTDHTPLDGYRISADYEKSFQNGSKLGVGIQPQWLTIGGDFGFDTLDTETNTLIPYRQLENAIDLSRGIYAGYVDYSAELSKFSYMVGLRLEYTDQVLDIENPDYFTIFDRATKGQYTLQQLDWFPSAHATYKVNDNNSFQLAFSRRISRPPVKEMAPFLYRRHFEVYVVGDPALKPEYITNFEAGYEKKFGEHTLGLTGFYRGVDNAIFRVNTIYTDELVLIRSYTNSGNSRSLGGEVNASFAAGKRIKVYLGGSLYQYHIQGEVFGYKEDNTSTNWSLKGNADVFLAKGLKWTTDFDVRSGTVTAQGENELFYMMNTVLNYTPQQLNGWAFSFKVLDLLASNITGLNTRAYNADRAQIFYQETIYTRQGPIAELGITYSFNNGKGKKKTESNFGKSEF